VIFSTFCHLQLKVTIIARRKHKLSANVTVMSHFPVSGREGFVEVAKTVAAS